MKRILFVMTSLSAGGAEKALVNLLTSIDYDKYMVDLLLLEKRGANLRYLPEKVNLLATLNDNNPLFYGGWEFIKFSIKNGNYIRMLRKIYYATIPLISANNSQRLKSFYAWKFMTPYIHRLDKEYDVAIGYIQGIPNYYIMDCVKAKYKIGWVHIDYTRIPKVSAEYEYFRNMDKVVTISDVCVESLKTVFPKLTNIEMIHNINCPKLIEELAVADVPSELDSSSAGIRLLTVGRFTYQKGYDMAIDAAVILKKKEVPFQWYVLGAGELEQDIKERIKKFGLDDNFTLLGIKENPYPYIKAVDIVVQTSRYEGKSIVIDEAKIMKKLIVSTNYASVGDQIRDGIDGIVVATSSEGIAEGIILLVNNSVLQKKIVSNLENQEFLQKEIIKKHYELFDTKK
jgi:glycosyltransferase involved in cell wall biosynthesis